MAVAARSAEDVTAPASRGAVDPRRTPAVRAGTVAWNGPDVVTGWHHHPLHQLEYALAGVAEVETEHGHFLLPPQQAMLIPAGVEHNTTLRGVRSVSVFFDPGSTPGVIDRARVLAAAPVIREMIRYARRWPLDRAADTDEARDYFAVLARVVVQWLDHEVPLHLPSSHDPLVVEIMALTRADLRGATAASVARAAGVSERTMRRHFDAACAISWQAYLVQARLLRAMALLVSTDRSVLAVANDVGFASPSGFVRAFRGLTGQTPSGYRHAVRAAAGG